MLYRVGDAWGIRSQFFDVVARELGVSFSQPVIVHQDEWRITVLITAQYWGRGGERLIRSEQVDIDVFQVLQEARLKWLPTKRETRQNKRGQQITVEVVDTDKLAALQAQGYCIDTPVYDSAGNLIGISRKLPPEVESALYKNILTLKKYAPRTAQTVAQRRLVQKIIGVKSIPMEIGPDGKPTDAPVVLKVWSIRDSRLVKTTPSVEYTASTTTDGDSATPPVTGVVSRAFKELVDPESTSPDNLTESELIRDISEEIVRRELPADFRQRLEATPLSVLSRDELVILLKQLRDLPLHTW
jgi:hypothetical protein